MNAHNSAAGMSAEGSGTAVIVHPPVPLPAFSVALSLVTMSIPDAPTHWVSMTELHEPSSMEKTPAA